MRTYRFTKYDFIKFPDKDMTEKEREIFMRHMLSQRGFNMKQKIHRYTGIDHIIFTQEDE